MPLLHKKPIINKRHQLTGIMIGDKKIMFDKPIEQVEMTNALEVRLEAIETAHAIIEMFGYIGGLAIAEGVSKQERTDFTKLVYEIILSLQKFFLE